MKLDLSRDGAIARLTIDNPPINSLWPAFFSQLRRDVRELATDSAVRVVVLTGAGTRTFSAGGDLAWMQQFSASQWWRMAEEIHAAIDDFVRLPQPTVGVVNGHAVGGGAELLLACDLTVMAEHARIGFPEINVGVFPGAGGSQRLLRRIGAARAKELMFFGELLSAQQAADLGLVNRVVPSERLLQTVTELATRLSTSSPVALRWIKEAVNRGSDMPLEGGLALERGLISLAFDTRDQKEGFAAFLQKRPPTFVGE
jgi:enoyl-CoA hydratase